jgi:hypothetical protein
MTSTELDFSFGSRMGLATACNAKTVRIRPAAVRRGSDGTRSFNAIDDLGEPNSSGKLTYVNHAAT